jgi:hypothetical protein
MMIDKLNMVAHRVRCATRFSAPNSRLELTKPPADANTEGSLPSKATSEANYNIQGFVRRRPDIWTATTSDTTKQWASASFATRGKRVCVPFGRAGDLVCTLQTA